MNRTLHELRLKFIVKRKESGEILAVFTTAQDAFEFSKSKFECEVKESY